MGKDINYKAERGNTKMKNINVFELNPRFDSRRSFYGKAQVIDYGNGVMELKSYDTIVSKVNNGKVEHLGKWSNTTTRHQKEFEKQFGY